MRGYTQTAFLAPQSDGTAGAAGPVNQSRDAYLFVIRLDRGAPNGDDRHSHPYEPLLALGPAVVRTIVLAESARRTLILGLQEEYR